MQRKPATVINHGILLQKGGEPPQQLPPKISPKKGKRPREREGRRQTGNIRSVDCPKSAVNPDVAKPASVNSVLEALQGGHGSFSRFLKLLHEKPYNNGSGPRTPSSSLKDFKLFPSLLVVPEHDRPRSNRRCSRVRGREDTWKHTYVVWALFTFLDGGCPYTQSDQVSLANRALANPWTSRHAESAGFCCIMKFIASLALDRMSLLDAGWSKLINWSH